MKIKINLKDPLKWQFMKAPSNLAELNLAKKAFDRDMMLKFAEHLKSQVLSNSFLLEKRRATFDLIDSLIAANPRNFKYVIDGMNILLKKRYSSSRKLNLRNLLELIDKESQCLVVLRDHVKVYDYFAGFKNVEFVYMDSYLEDDKFSLYAAMRSNIADGGYLVSNDYMGNHLPHNELGHMAKVWLRHKRVTTDHRLEELIYSDVCELRVQSVGKYGEKWFVPCKDVNKIGEECIYLLMLTRK